MACVHNAAERVAVQWHVSDYPGFAVIGRSVERVEEAEVIIFLTMSVMLNIALALLALHLRANPVCKHKWEIIKRTTVSYVDFGDPDYDHTILTLQCQHCGNVKKKKAG